MLRLLLLVTAFCFSGCCVGFATKVRNESGRAVSIETKRAFDGANEVVMIPAGASRLCSGVALTLGTPDCWIISDGHSHFVFEDVSPIARLKWPAAIRSRFTKIFPCSCVTRHVSLDTNMLINAVGSTGQRISQPAGFPIHFTNSQLVF